MFDSDPELFIRDIANFPQESISRFFKFPSLVTQAVKRSRQNPFNFVTHEFDPDFVAKSPHSRYMHFDLSLGGDLCAFAMGYASHFLRLNQLKAGKLVTEKLPFIHIDFVGVILVERTQEVWLPQIPELIEQLISKGFNISLVTFDRFQSAYIMQILKDRGLLTDLLSIDRTATKVIIDLDRPDNIRRESTGGSYLSAMAACKDAVNQQRIDIPFHPTVSGKFGESEFESETKSAEVNPNKQIVEHTGGGKIDLVQAVAGVCFNIENNERELSIDNSAIENAQDPYYKELNKLSPGFVERGDTFGRGEDRNASFLG